MIKIKQISENFDFQLVFSNATNFWNWFSYTACMSGRKSLSRHLLLVLVYDNQNSPTFFAYSIVIRFISFYCVCVINSLFFSFFYWVVSLLFFFCFTWFFAFRKCVVQRSCTLTVVYLRWITQIVNNKTEMMHRWEQMDVQMEQEIGENSCTGSRVISDQRIL